MRFLNRRTRISLVAPTVIAAAVFGAAWLIFGGPERVFADHGNNQPSPDLAFNFQNGNVSGWAIADDHTPTGSVYEERITFRINEWNSLSEVKPTRGYVANHSTNRIHFWQVNLGTNGPLGRALMYSNENYSTLQPCTDASGALTYLCNKTDHQATYADIDLNHDLMADGSPYGTFLERNHTVGHEIGHVFGISHLVCNDGSTGIMKVTACGNVQAFVQSHDVLDANRLY